MKKILILSVFISLTGFCLQSQPGNPDGDFDADGKLMTAIGTGEDIGCDVVVQPDGRIIVAGYAATINGSDGAFVRYFPDGSLDNSFGAGGIVLVDVASMNDYIVTVVLQDDGKIIAGGTSITASENDFLVIRLNTDGSPDISFGTNGIVITDFSGFHDVINSIDTDSDGKIIAAGYTSDGATFSFAIAKYNTDGSLDQSFADHGLQVTSVGDGDDYANGVVVQPDDKIVAAGLSVNNGSGEIGIVRYNPNGTPDNTFGFNGMVMTDIQTWYDYANSIVLQPDGKIIVAGNSQNAVNYDFGIVRYNPDGSLDLTFSDDGRQVADISSEWDYAQSIVLQPDGKILVAGATDSWSGLRFVLARYNPDGNPDSTFAFEGIANTTFTNPPLNCYGRSVTLQPNGRIIVAGSAENGTNEDFAVARYISGLNIGIIDFTTDNNSVFICPNPVKDGAVLKYTLAEPGRITIRLVDEAGQPVDSFIENQMQTPGLYEMPLAFDAAMKPGIYFIVISSDLGKCSLKILKG